MTMNSDILIVSGQNCTACTKLINMMNKANMKFEVKNQEDVPMLRIQTVPTIIKDGIRIFVGCPGSIEDLRKVIRRG